MRLVLALFVALSSMLVPALVMALCFGMRAHIDPSNPFHLAALLGALGYGVLCGRLVTRIGLANTR